jgi:hypothetical protein
MFSGFITISGETGFVLSKKLEAVLLGQPPLRIKN